MESCSTSYAIRQYRAEDEHEVVALRNLCMSRDEIVLNTFRRKIILDANFDPRSCFVTLGEEKIVVALKDNKVVGFSHFLDERFGPFGIDKACSGLGLEPMLYYYTVDQMRRKGRHNLWLAWTTGRTKDFYHKVGLKVLRRHEVMKKIIA